MTQAEVDAFNARRHVKNSSVEFVEPSGIRFDGPENELHDQIIEELNRRRWLFFHGSMAHKAKRTLGEPDFEIYGSKGRHWLIEAKTKDGKLSHDQLIVKMLAEMNGHEIHIVRSFEQFLKIINGSDPKPD